MVRQLTLNTLKKFKNTVMSGSSKCLVYDERLSRNNRLVRRQLQAKTNFKVLQRKWLCVCKQKINGVSTGGV